MDEKKQIKSTDWLAARYSKEEIAKMKAEAIKEAETELREKQIEEMAKALKEAAFGVNTQTLADHLKPETINKVAEYLYNAGYRKQSEGEWKKANEKYPRYVCTACNHLYNNKEYKYCPNCGAKMKGGE